MDNQRLLVWALFLMLAWITWQQWKVINEEIIGIIRAHDALGIPLVGGFNWAYELRLSLIHI